MNRIVLVLLPLTGCAPASPPDTPGMQAHCVVERVGDQVGQEATPRLVARARERAGASLVRVIHPGQPVTMDYRQGRLNIAVDAHNRIEHFTCG